MATLRSNPFFSFPAKIPPSATHTGLNLLAIIPALALTYWSVSLGTSALDTAALAIASTAGSFLLVEIVLRRSLLSPESGLRLTRPDWSFRRVFFKLVALLAIAGIATLAYTALPEYGKGLYRPFFLLAKTYGWIVLLTVIPYIATVDAYLNEPEDTYLKLGARILGHPSSLTGSELKNLLSGWLVKAFFLPLMFSFLVTHVTSMATLEFSTQNSIEHIMFGIDVMIGTVGYLLTLRPLGTHIRTADPSLLGWCVALACYPPFNGVTSGSYFDYRKFLDPIGSGDGSFLVEYLTNLASLISLFIYTIATVSFGIRFSNLTNRGIITGGPYRYVKHPAYLSKNAFWWLEVLTHLSNDWFQAIRAILLMAGMSALYWARARTEEIHLMRDQGYVEYVCWIDQHGLVARFRRLFRSR